MCMIFCGQYSDILENTLSVMDDIKERVNHNNATATIFEMLNGNEIANKFGIYASMHACKLLHHMLISMHSLMFPNGNCRVLKELDAVLLNETNVPFLNNKPTLNY